MVESRQDRPEWVDMGALQRLAQRVAASTAAPAEAWWHDGARPVLTRHWALADHDWHRRRVTSTGGVDREETDHQLTRYALLPDGRLVRALSWWSEARRDPEGGVLRAGPAQGEVRALVARDVRTLDQRTTTTRDPDGAAGTWGTLPSGVSGSPWAGAAVEHLLKALLA